jgi:hypothetical protein
MDAARRATLDSCMLDACIMPWCQGGGPVCLSVMQTRHIHGCWASECPRPRLPRMVNQHLRLSVVACAWRRTCRRTCVQAMRGQQGLHLSMQSVVRHQLGLEAGANEAGAGRTADPPGDF